MTEPTDAMGRDSLRRDAAPWLGPVRIAIGLLQGLGLLWLHRASDGVADWPATQPMLFGPLLLVIGMLPVMLLAGVGQLRLTTLIVWTAVAGAGLALLGLHDVARQGEEALRHPPFLSAPAILFSAAALFIAHHLVAPADIERRRIAGYPTYFNTVTKAVVQLALSLAFTGAFWALLQLGSALFRIIGLDFLEDLLRKDWIYVPVTFLVFSVAVHLTDVRDGLIRGVRTVGLMLLSWLLLVMTVIVAGFVIALPFTGLQGLWETGSATALVLSAAAALIILINAAYQDGRPDNRPPAVLRVAVRVAAVLITPLVVVAFWGLALRIGQHGLTPERIIAAACAVVGAVFAAGYGWAALSPFWRKVDWMRPLERTTLAAAALALVLILALFSPLIDPARLSVMDQVARLERGAVAPDKFDFRFLRFQSGKVGQEALARLARSSNREIARLARAMAGTKYRHEVDFVEPVPSAKNVRIEGAPGVLPATFAAELDRHLASLDFCTGDSICQARTTDLDQDGREELLIANVAILKVFSSDAGRWSEAAAYYQAACPGDSSHVGLELKAGRVQPAPPGLPDLIVDGRHMRKSETLPGCAGPPAVVPR